MVDSKYIEVALDEKNVVLSSNELSTNDDDTPVIVPEAMQMRRNEHDNDSPTEREIKVGSGVLCGLLGCLVGGPILAAIFGTVAARFTLKEGAAGDVARSAGELALFTHQKALDVNEKHHLVERTKDATLEVVERTKKASQEFFRTRSVQREIGADHNDASPAY